MDYFNLGEQDVWYCEGCMQQFRINNGLEIHHIHGRGKNKDIIENLMSLCVKHHKMATLSQITPEEFQIIHRYFMNGSRKQFLK